MTGLTWVHLSDWHQAKRKFNRKVVLKALIEDIKGREKIDPKLKKIDFIVFSGDAANAAQPDEYKDAIEDLFKPLLDACQIGPDRLFIVPGNHDLDRDLIPAALQKPLLSNEEVEPWWSEEKKRRQLLQPFQAYNGFLTDCTGQKPPEYCNIGSLSIDGKRVSLIGINSAWMCARHKDEAGEVSDQGYLCIGEPQIYDSLESISCSDIKIAVLHHPLDWLAPFDLSRNEVHLKRKCNFILHGHAHKPGASAIRDNFGYYIAIPAGACYDRRMAQNSAYTYSYNFVHLDFERDSGIVFPRSWSDLNRKWRKDDEAFSTTNGEFHFSISGSEKAPIPHQIPPPPKDFKGRETEISDILSNFEKGATITGLRGMGGVGKTALALVIAERIKSLFPDGQIFIDMRGTSNKPDLPPLTPAEAMAHVIRAYHPADRLPESENELSGLYHSVLDGKSVLLLLDNAAGREQVELLLPPSSCSILITSRIKFTLPGLAEKDLDILPLGEACELLVEIAPRIEGRAEGLAETCGRLPLALRNAASVLAERKDLSVPEYERRLKNKVELLELVKGSFSLSYDLLTPFRKKHWRRLSVFPKDFDRNAATAVLKMAPGPSAEALSDLVRWSLVDFIPVADSDVGRYRLHDLARLFAESCLEGDELADAQQKHARHYSKVLSQSEALYLKGGQDLLAGLDLFDREWANIRAGQAWVKSIVQGAGGLKKRDLNSVQELAISYADDAADISDLRLHPRDYINWLDTGLKAAKKIGNRSAESAQLSNLGSVYADLGETFKAIGYQEQALKIFRNIGERKNEGATLGNLGNAYTHLGKVRRAIEYYEGAVAILKEIGDLRGEGAHLGNLGLAYANLGETRKAIDYCEESIAILNEIGDRRNEGAHMGSLGIAYAIMGETNNAITYYDQALSIAREIGDKENETETLCNLGNTYLDLNDQCKAINYCTQSLVLARNIEYKKFEGESLNTLGRAYTDLGQLDLALDHCDQALKIFREIEFRRGEAEALFNRSLALEKLARREEAVASAKEAQQIFQKIESPKAEKVSSKLAEWSAPQGS
jgi:tetratricopeptide (TPR) repeat protein/predicted phosphodiesterase